MRFFLDTEFYEEPGKLNLISLGLVSETGREYYAEADFNPQACNDWVRENVFPHLRNKPVDIGRHGDTHYRDCRCLVLPKGENKWIRQIGLEIQQFIYEAMTGEKFSHEKFSHDGRPIGLESSVRDYASLCRLPEGMQPKIWTYYGAYDWVAFCHCFGAMVNLPKGYPMYPRDLKAVLDAFGNPEVPSDLGVGKVVHNALDDARWLRAAWDWLHSENGGAKIASAHKRVASPYPELDRMMEA